MKKSILSLIGIFLVASFLAAGLDCPVTSADNSLAIAGISDPFLPENGDFVVQADLVYRNNQYKNTLSPRLFLFPRDFESFLSQAETTALFQAGPNAPAAEVSIPEGCEISTNLAYEIKLFELINEERVKRHLEPLEWNDTLASAARKHSIDMACSDFFSHKNRERLSFEDRIANEGYDYFAVGENIYAGDEVFNSPYRAFRAWFYSTDHFVVMTHSALTEVGIGYVYGTGSRYGGYFTADFASPAQ